MTHTGHAWAPTGTPGRCLEGVTPGTAGIFSALSYFVAETPTMFYLVSDLKISACTFFSYIAYCDESHTLIQAHIWAKRRKSKCPDRKTDYLWQKNHNRKDVTDIKETLSICQVNSKKFQNWQPFCLVLGMVQPQIKKMFAWQILPLLSLSLIFY